MGSTESTDGLLAKAAHQGKKLNSESCKDTGRRCVWHYQQGPWRSSKTPGINQALPDAYLKSEELFALRDDWIVSAP